MTPIALAGGRTILDVAASPLDVTTKDDSSPVTVADRAAEAVICNALRSLYPDVPIVAEEQAALEGLAEIRTDRFFLVDPLDGTKEFIENRPDYTVNIAYVEDGVPLLGVVYAPARRELYFGSADGAFFATVAEATDLFHVQPIAARPRPSRPVVVCSRSHSCSRTEAYVRSVGECDFVSIGSSLKFCHLAAGKADLYPRFGRTMEWDTAAGQAVLLAAGGGVRELDGAAMVYGKRNRPDDVDFANRAFIAFGLQ